jgi:hypothetical protein
MAKKEAPKKRGRKPKNHEPVTLFMDQVDLANLERLHAQMRAAQSELILQQMARRSYIEKIDPTGGLNQIDSSIRKLSSERAESEKEYKDLTAAIESKLGISLKEYAYDDKTGALRFVNESKTEEKTTVDLPTV